MKSVVPRLLLALSLLGPVTACDDDDDPTGPATETFRALLNGANERPDARTTPATGTASFTLRRDTLYWTITMSSISNVTAAHIHIGDATETGGVLLPLTPGTTGVNNTRIDGMVARSAFVAPGPPNAAVTFDALLGMMRTGDAYVNVHTNNTANDPTNNSGPGDFPAGEIRGQITPVT